MQRDDGQGFVVIVPTTEPAPPPNAEALAAALEASFPGYTFKVIGSGQLRMEVDDDEAAAEFGLDSVSVMPLMKMGTLTSPPVEPDFELIEQISQHVQMLQMSPRPN